jgi:hypothetical protein
MLVLILRPTLVFLYAGPDQLLPLASFIGAVIGVLLIGWQRLVMFVRRVLHLLARKFQPSAKKVKPATAGAKHSAKVTK